MEKNTENNIAKIMIVIIIVLISFFILLFSGKLDSIIHNNKVNNKVNNTSIENIDHDINGFLSEITEPLGWLIIRHTYSQEANRTGVNYFLDEYDRQVFVFENIVDRDDNNDYFIVLDASTGEKIDKEPTSESTLAYFPYSIFNEKYRVFFNDDFDVTNKVEYAGNDNEYAKSDEYVFYPNSHPGAEGLSIEKIDLIDLKYDEKAGKYIANVNMTYSEKLANDIGMKDEKAEIIYHLNNGNIILESFVVGTNL